MKAFLQTYKGSVAMIAAALVLGIIVIVIWATARQQVTPEEVDRARTNCVEWIETYDMESDTQQAILACQTAENADPRSFYFRWVPGQYGKIDPPKPTDIPESSSGTGWYPEGAG